MPEHGIGNPPVDTKCRIIPAHNDLILWAVVLVAFVEKVGGFRQHDEAMGAASWHEKLNSVLLRHLHGYMAAEGGAADAHIHRDIQDLPADHAHQLALSFRVLQV